MAVREIEIAAAGRPHPEETVSGDAWRADWHEGHCRIAVVDGLGHGPAAENAALRAMEVLAARPELGPVEGLQYCHEALRSTRGAALTIVRIDPRSMHLSHAGVGNVDTHVSNKFREQRLIPQRGIVGNILPRLMLAELDLSGDWTLVLHSDGVSSRFVLDSVLAEHPGGPADVANTLLEQWSRPMDDAMVVVASPAGDPGSDSALASPSDYVLLVEDDRAIRELLCQIVATETGLPVMAAENTVSALEMIGRAASVPALALLDLNLPGSSGESLAKAVQERAGAAIPHMFISAAPEGAISDAARRTGAVGYITKPFQVDEVARAVRSALQDSKPTTP